MDPEWLRRTRKPRSDRVFAKNERAGVRGNRCDRGGGGVDRLADGVSPDLCRRARVRLQVEPRVDARHAPLYVDRPDPPEVPPQRPHLRAPLCLSRELYPAAEP